MHYCTSMCPTKHDNNVYFSFVNHKYAVQLLYVPYTVQYFTVRHLFILVKWFVKSEIVMIDTFLYIFLSVVWLGKACYLLTTVCIVLLCVHNTDVSCSSSYHIFWRQSRKVDRGGRRRRIFNTFLPSPSLV